MPKFVTFKNLEQYNDKIYPKIKNLETDVSQVVDPATHMPIEATTASVGVVQLATAQDITNGTAGKVVDAKELADAIGDIKLADSAKFSVVAGANIDTTGIPTVTYNNGTFTFNYLKGTKGDQGIQGPKGDKGDTGATGPQGLKGDTPDSIAWDKVSGKPSTFTPSSHTHDDRYYTESEIDTKLSDKANATDLSNYLRLSGGNVTGNLTVQNKNVVRSVNGVNADANGNVEITTSGSDLSGVVKSVNNIQPDESGNVEITIPKPITNIVGVTDNRNLGEIFYSALPQTSSQVHLLDGSVLTDAAELYDYLESIKDSNPDLFTTDSEFNSEVESTGKCSKFVMNSENGSVRIPKADSNNYIVIKSFEKKFEFNQPFSLLEPKWSDVPLNNPSWLLSNGQENSQENYPSVYELLLNEYNNGTLKSETIGDTTISYKQLDNGHKVVTDKTAYESILKNTGTAWYYLLDLDAKTFILPQTNGFMKYGNSNQFIKQSLPNIKGQTGYTVTSGDDETTPPFEKLYVSPYGTVSGNSSSYPAKFVRFGFDASTYLDVYQDDANVNPNSVQGYLYFYVGEALRPANIVDLGIIKDRLDLDITNLKSGVTELNKLKGNISILAFPSEKNVVLTIPASGTTLTAPANGWFVYQSFGDGTTYDYMFMSNTTTAYYGCQTRDLVDRGVYTSCPAKKGEEVYFEWVDSATTRNLKFIYATDQDIEE